MTTTFLNLITARTTECFLDFVWDHKDFWKDYISGNVDEDRQTYLVDDLLKEALRKAVLLAEKQENELRNP